MKSFDDMGPGVRTLFSLTLMLSMYVPTVALAQETVQGYKPFRYDEDYRYLRDPTLRTDFWDPLKYIPLGGDSNTYLSFGGELRERFESYSPTSFGLKGGNDNAYVLHRLLLSADLHITQYFRAFLQLGNELAAEKNQPLSPTDVDRLDLQQAFIDVKVPISELDPTLRIGRQEISFRRVSRQTSVVASMDFDCSTQSAVPGWTPLSRVPFSSSKASSTTTPVISRYSGVFTPRYSLLRL
jgi:hypothetical protein